MCPVKREKILTRGVASLVDSEDISSLSVMTCLAADGEVGQGAPFSVAKTIEGEDLYQAILHPNTTQGLHLLTTIDTERAIIEVDEGLDHIAVIAAVVVPHLPIGGSQDGLVKEGERRSTLEALAADGQFPPLATSGHQVVFQITMKATLPSRTKQTD
jgi:hypothetical protein